MTLLCSLLTPKGLRQGLVHSRGSVNICGAGDQRPWISPELLPESQDLESQAGLKGWGHGRGNIEPPFFPPRPLVTLSPISLCSLAISLEETQSPAVFLHHPTCLFCLVFAPALPLTMCFPLLCFPKSCSTSRPEQFILQGLA